MRVIEATEPAYAEACALRVKLGCHRSAWHTEIRCWPRRIRPSI